MPNFTPYVLLLVDAILVFAICRQLKIRVSLYTDFSHLPFVQEIVSYRRKDVYRIVILITLLLKTTDSILWIFYEGWNGFDFSSNIQLWLFWFLYGLITSILSIMQGDFTSVVVTVNANIKRRQSKYIRAFIMGTAVMSSIIIMWGCIISSSINYTPMWQYFGFSSSVLNGYVTYKMTRSIIKTTEETKNSTYSIKDHISRKEWNKQIVTLFRFRQMMACLFSICIYSIYAVIINIYLIISKDLILQPILGNKPLYLWSKLILFNFYFYGMISLFLIYSWVSYVDVKNADDIHIRRNTKHTPIDPENEFVIPDTQEIIYNNPQIDPNNQPIVLNNNNINIHNNQIPNQLIGMGERHNSYDTVNTLSFPIASTHKTTPRTTIEMKQMHQINSMHKRGISHNSPRNSDSGDEILTDVEEELYIPPTPIATPNKSPNSKLSVRSHTNTITTINIPSNDVTPRKIIRAHTIDNVYNPKKFLKRNFQSSISLGHRAQSSFAGDINVKRFIQESKKLNPTTTMFDLNIVKMRKMGCSLEKIYFETQKYRGMTKKSLRLTNKMRTISYNEYEHGIQNSSQSQINIARNSVISPYQNSRINGAITPSLTQNAQLYNQPLKSMNINKKNNNNSQSLLVQPTIDNDNDISLSDHEDVRPLHQMSINNKIKIIDQFNTLPEDKVLTPNKGKKTTPIIIDIMQPDIMNNDDEKDPEINDLPP